MLYNKGKILIGIVIFAAVVSFPFWINLASSKYEEPKIELPKNGTECIETKEFMRANHMTMLLQWRDDVVRGSMHEYKSETTGKIYKKSLTKTCLKCHPNKEKFCDACHIKVGAEPTCWQCHVVPAKGGK